MSRRRGDRDIENVGWKQFKGGDIRVLVFPSKIYTKLVRITVRRIYQQKVCSYLQTNTTKTVLKHDAKEILLLFAWKIFRNKEMLHIIYISDFSYQWFIQTIHFHYFFTAALTKSPMKNAFN